MLDLSEIEQLDLHSPTKTGPSTFFKAKDAFGTPVAVKRIPFKKPASTSEFQDDYPAVEQVRREAKILKQLSSHPHIIRLIRYDEDKDYCYLRFPYYQYNLADLNGVMKEKKPILDQDTILYIAKQILQALQYMHSKNMLHLDIRPDNIMVDCVDHKYVCKLIDYGACLTKEEAAKHGCNFTNSTGYLSPERFTSQEVSEKSDVFSFGATLFSLVYNQDPFSYLKLTNSTLTRDTYLNTLRENHLKLEGTLHPEVKEMLTKCLQFSPDKRPSIKDLLKQETISGIEHLTFDSETQKQEYVDKLNKLRVEYPKINLLNKRNNSEKSKLQDLDGSPTGNILPLLDKNDFARSDFKTSNFGYDNPNEESGAEKSLRGSSFQMTESYMNLGYEFYIKNPEWLAEITSNPERKLETYIGNFKDDLPDGMNNTLIFSDGTVATLTFRNFCISGIVKVKKSSENSTQEYTSYQYLDSRLPNTSSRPKTSTRLPSKKARCSARPLASLSRVTGPPSKTARAA